MSIKIHRRDCKFIVKPEERMVICVIEGDYVSEMLLEYIDEVTGTSVEIWPRNHKLRKRLRMPHSFTGRAVCAEGDEWNEELGRKIAYSRAKNKLYTSFFKRANAFIQEADYTLNQMITNLNTFGEKLDKQRTNLEENIENMLQKE